MIDTSTWHPFEIGTLFNVVKGKRLTKKDMIDGDIPFIGSSAFNNGVTNYIGNENNIHEGNLITVAYNGSVGETFYHDYKFIASDDVNVLYPKFNLNKYIALFMCPIIKKAGQSYEFVDKWKKEDMEKTSVYLPAISKDEPDFMYMEKYMKITIERANDTLEKMKGMNFNRNLIDIRKWKNFDCNILFDCQNTGNILARDVIDGSGDTPFVTASGYNNGVVAHIDASKYDIIKGHCILVGGKTFTITYQKEDFVSNDSHNFVVRILGYEISELTYLYLASVIYNYFGQKYSWNDAVTKDRLKSEKIPLPATDNGEPDWQYMEDYMKKIKGMAEHKIYKLKKIKELDI